MSHIEIDGGLVTAATIVDATGTHTIFNEIGAWRFFVALIDDEGRETVWDGPSYEDAILTAERLAKDHGPVHDLVVAARGGGP